MGLEIKLTDQDLPISPMFVEFLDRHLHATAGGTEWHSEAAGEWLVPVGRAQQVEYTQAAMQRILQLPEGSRAVYRAYELCVAILTGQLAALAPIQERFRFLCIVGCPRHGGTFLTKELFSAVGIDPATVPNAVAHDGFPNLRQFTLQERFNVNTVMTQQLAEYLAMVEVYFRNAQARGGCIVVPKKATKAAFQGALLHSVLGPRTEYVVTLRHPLPACISTYEKSGGLPADGRFARRSTIESWVLNDWTWMGEPEAAVCARDYFDVYLGYWERYHVNLALSGLTAGKHIRFVAYGKERFTAIAREYRERYGAQGALEPFHVSTTTDRHPEWRARAEAAVQRVAVQWERAGWRYPVDEVMESQ